MVNDADPASKPLPSSKPKEEELAALFESHRARLVAWVTAQLSPRLAARLGPEDVVQNAFLRAYPRWEKAQREVKSLETWLSRMVHDQLVEEMRSALGRWRDCDQEVALPDNSVDQIALQLFGRSRSSPSKGAQRHERRELVRKALTQLGPIDADILILFSQGLTYKEIGLVMDMKESAVNKRCLRALEKLGELLPPRSALF
jgi:RNA polymerase sigma factor (sigma-70 family)